MIKYIPILLYHKIGPSCPNQEAWVLTSVFQKQMSDIRDLNYTPILIQNFFDYHLGIQSLPEKPIIITFDDAYENFYTEAIPIMLNLDIKSVCFVPTGYIGKTNKWDNDDPDPEIRHMNWDQIQTLHVTNMVDFQSHTDIHPDLVPLSSKEILVELIHSKVELQNRLRKRIDFIAWPFGSFDTRCIKAAQASGYIGAFAVRNSIQKLNDIQPYAIRRISIGNSENEIYRIDAQLTRMSEENKIDSV